MSTLEEDLVARTIKLKRFVNCLFWFLVAAFVVAMLFCVFLIIAGLNGTGWDELLVFVGLYLMAIACLVVGGLIAPIAIIRHGLDHEFGCCFDVAIGLMGIYVLIAILGVFAMISDMRRMMRYGGNINHHILG